MFERLLPNPATYQREGALQQDPLATSMGYQPDMTSTLTRNSGDHSFCLLNVLGYIPALSTVSGTYRAMIGLALTVKSLACLIFDRSNHNQHAKALFIGAANLGRGLLEIVPIIGNLFVINIDVSRMLYRWADNGYPYGDRNTIPIFKKIDEVGGLPLIGTIPNILRAAFFTFHFLINIPPAILGKKHGVEAIKFSADQIGIGLIESFPCIGFISAFSRNVYYTHPRDIDDY